MNQVSVGMEFARNREELAGIWDLIHLELLDCLSRCSKIDWSTAIVDSCKIGVAALQRK